MTAPAPCPTCGQVDPPELAGWSFHLCSGFRPATPAEAARVELSPEARARLLAFMDDADRARGRAAVAAQTAFVG